MIVCDINILVAAFRTDHPEHNGALGWLTDSLNGNEPIGIPDNVWSGFLRIVTNRRIFLVPATLAEAFEFVHAVDQSPATTRISSPLDLNILEQSCTTANAVGDLVPDAYLASLALSLGASIATYDRDFRRFDGLRIIEPPRADRLGNG